MRKTNHDCCNWLRWLSVQKIHSKLNKIRFLNVAAQWVALPPHTKKIKGRVHAVLFLHQTLVWLKSCKHTKSNQVKRKQ